MVVADNLEPVPVLVNFIREQSKPIVEGSETEKLVLTNIISEPVEVSSNIYDFELSQFISTINNINMLSSEREVSSLNSPSENPSQDINDPRFQEISELEMTIQTENNHDNGKAQDNIDDTGSNESKCVGKEGKRKARKDSDKIIRKKSRMEGKQYETLKGILVNEKVMGENPCVGRKCTKSVKCHLFTEPDRKCIF